MNKKTKTEQWRQQLTDAQDGLLSDEALHRLEKEVKAHDPDLWRDHHWMMEQQSGKGVFAELAAMRDEQPETGAIQRLYARVASQRGSGAELEEIVWSWFRRYVLTFGILLIILLAGLQSGGSGISEANISVQLESFLGWSSEEFPELDHWLYEDFDIP